MSFTNSRHRRLIPLIVLGILALGGCNRSSNGWEMMRVDRTVGASKYPLAVEPSRVGSYPPETNSGSGEFYDDVLEYRVWLHPERGAVPINGNDDYFVAFAQYERAEQFFKSKQGAEEPIVLIRQREWIDEPRSGEYHAMKGERITEWQVGWLADNKRGPESIAQFLKHPPPATADEGERVQTSQSQ